VGTEPQSAVRGARWSYRGPLSRRAVRAAIVQEAPLKIYARGVVSYFYFSRVPRARAENQANQQYHFKSSRCCMDPLGTDSCRETVSMELPVPNVSMQHREPKSEIDDTRILLQRASCTLAAKIKLIITSRDACAAQTRTNIAVKCLQRSGGAYMY
jgi:hypothetical protein